MIGKQISHYHILEKLGEGGMGVVYKAEDTKLKRTVALKFLPPELTGDPEAKKRFIHEAQAASALEHTNICNIHEIGETEDHQLFIVMSCYEGQTLKESIGTIQLAIDKVIDIAIQTAEGLQEAHAKNIIHRDIKPANIMITEKGQIKIMDFGLAKLKGRTVLTKESSTLGTVAYMSPEQVRGETVDHRTDIWSLGVVLYEMVTGKPPFKGEYDQVVMYSITNEEPEPLTAVRSGVPMELERITSKMLAKDPAERYQHLDELLVDLKKVKTTSDRSKASTTSEIPRKKSVRMLYPVSGIIILVIIGVASWTIVQKRSNQQQKRKFIAVLPFHPITKSEEDQSFAEGIHDDILTQLSKISDLRIIARTSVMRYQDTQKSIKEIASELGVGTVLEGSTRRSGDVIRVTAQLIDGETEEHLWADSYDEPYADVFAIQSNIAQKIASALQVRLAEEELRSIQTQPTKNMLAYEYYQKGKYFWHNSFNYEGNLKAAQMFEKACMLDTTFALAWAWQAITYSTVSVQSSSISQWDVFVRKSEFALKKTESLAPDLPEVNLARYHYLNNIKNDLDAALKEIEIANLKRPNDGNILYTKSYLMTMTGDPQSGLTLAEKVYQLDPKGSGGAYFAAWNTMLLGRYQEAERWSDIMIANNPESGEGYHMKMSAILAGLGDLDRAEIILTEAQKLVTRDRWNLTIREYLLYLYKRDYNKALLALAGWEFPERFLYRAAVFQLLNNRQEAIANFDSARIFYSEILNQQPKFRWTSTRLLLAVAYAGLGEKSKALQEMAQVADLSRIQQTSMRGLENITFYLLLGDEENAFLQLEKAVASYFGPTPAELRLDPRLDPLRDNPKFKQLIDKAERLRKN